MFVQRHFPLESPDFQEILVKMCDSFATDDMLYRCTSDSSGKINLRLEKSSVLCGRQDV